MNPRTRRLRRLRRKARRRTITVYELLKRGYPRLEVLRDLSPIDSYRIHIRATFDV